MKHLAFTVTATGDVNELTVIGLVKFDDEKLKELSYLRQAAVALNTQMKSIQRSFAYVSLWTTDVHWLVLGHDDVDEATEKIYEKLCDTEEGVLEIPEDVYDGRVRKHTELYRSAKGYGLLRTESDFIHATENGVYYSCAEKYCYAHHETHMVSWKVLFDEVTVR